MGPVSRLLYLDGTDVLTAMPPVEDRLDLAGRALRALAGSAQLPPKIGVHPRPDASWAHAMPAWVPGTDETGAADLLGVKFVSGFPANATRGLPAIHATLLLCDPTTGRPRAILDAGPITAARTAAVSGAVIAAWGPRTPSPTVGLVGAGVQAEAHVEVLGHVLPGCRLRIHDRDARRAASLVDRALAIVGVAGAHVSATPEGAISGADVALTMVSFGPDRQAVAAQAFRDVPLVVTVDYDMCLPAAIAREADAFLVDETGQFLANRGSGIFAGYPDPTATIGERLDGSRPAGRLAVVHLGTGVADLVFGDAILAAADERGLGTTLPD